MPPPASFDAVVIGAGAAGLMCAAVAGQRGARVLLVDHAERLAEKIRISGGGRCNFTNRSVGPENFLSANPHFARSALARYAPADFIALVRRHRIAFHEKHRGQLFCDESSEQIIAMLVAECEAGRVAWRRPCEVGAIVRAGDGYEVQLPGGAVRAAHVVVATGGLSVPKIGATDFGYRVARQFGQRIVEPRPALVPLTFHGDDWAPFVPLAGVSLEVEVRTGTARGGDRGAGAGRFREDLLFTHRGLSGPAILQISSYWNPGAPIVIDLAPGAALGEALRGAKRAGRQTLGAALAQWLPRRLAEGWLDLRGLAPDERLADLPDRALDALADSLHAWTLVPSGTEGYRKAEVTRGGVATDGLSQTSFVARTAPGLHFIGEVVDVTGWLGGYNFQWAWASGHACGEAIGEGAAARRAA